MLKVNTILLLLSISFIAVIQTEDINELAENNKKLLGPAINVGGPNRKILDVHKQKIPRNNHPVSHSKRNSPKHNSKKNKNKFKNKKEKFVSKLEKLSLGMQSQKPTQVKYFFDDIFPNINSLQDFQNIFPPNLFSFASQSIPSNTVLINIRNKPDPASSMTQQIQAAFQNPNIQFVAIDEIAPDVFAKKTNNKFNRQELQKKTQDLLKNLFSLSSNAQYTGRINVFITDVSIRLFNNYPEYKNFIGEILRLAHNNYLGYVFVENYRGPLSSELSNVCLKSSNNRRGCLDATAAPINRNQWSSTVVWTPSQALSGFRSLLGSLCGECKISELVMPTFGLSNRNGVVLNGCFKKVGCRNDLVKISNLIKSFANDNTKVAFYGAHHLVDTTELVIQNGKYYTVESLICEITSAAIPNDTSCYETSQ